MQYTISINQKAFREIAPDCDLIDAAIFDFISRFMAVDEVEYITDKDGNRCFWISYNHIIRELPIIGISTKRAIYNRMDNLIQAGLIGRYEGNQTSQKSYFRQGPQFKNVVWDSYGNKPAPMNESSEPSERGFRTRMNEDSEPPMNAGSDNQYTNKHQYTKNRRETRARVRVDSDLVPEALNEIPGFQEKFEQYCRYLSEQFGIKVTGPVIESKLDRLLQLKKEGENVPAVIDQTIGGINKSFFPVRKFGNEKQPLSQEVVDRLYD